MQQVMVHIPVLTVEARMTVADGQDFTESKIRLAAGKHPRRSSPADGSPGRRTAPIAPGVLEKARRPIFQRPTMKRVRAHSCRAGHGTAAARRLAVWAAAILVPETSRRSWPASTRSPAWLLAAPEQRNDD